MTTNPISKFYTNALGGALPDVPDDPKKIPHDLVDRVDGEFTPDNKASLLYYTIVNMVFVMIGSKEMPCIDWSAFIDKIYSDLVAFEPSMIRDIDGMFGPIMAPETRRMRLNFCVWDAVCAGNYDHFVLFEELLGGSDSIDPRCIHLCRTFIDQPHNSTYVFNNIDMWFEAAIRIPASHIDPADLADLPDLDDLAHFEMNDLAYRLFME